MADPSLVKYIKRTRKLDIPDEVVKEKLLQTRWPYEEIVDAFNNANKKKSHIILSRKFLSKFAVFVLVIAFFIPPLGIALALIAYGRLKDHKFKEGHEFVTASFVVGMIGTLSLSYILVSHFGLIPGIGGVTGRATQDCSDGICVEEPDTINNIITLNMKNDINSDIVILDAKLDCLDSQLVRINPEGQISEGEKFELKFECPESSFKSIDLSYQIVTSGEIVTINKIVNS